MLLDISIVPYPPVKELFYFEEKESRIYAGSGVSQTPIEMQKRKEILEKRRFKRQKNGRYQMWSGKFYLTN